MSDIYIVNNIDFENTDFTTKTFTNYDLAQDYINQLLNKYRDNYENVEQHENEYHLIFDDTVARIIRFQKQALAQPTKISNDDRIQYLRNHDVAIYYYSVVDPDLYALFNDPAQYAASGEIHDYDPDDSFYALEDEHGRYLTTGTAEDVVKFLDQLILQER